MRQIVFEESLNGITIDRIIRDYEYNMPTKHFHDEYEVYYLLEGERYYFIEQQTYLVKKGSLVFVNRGQIHKTGLAGTSYHDRILIELKEEPFASFFSFLGDLSLKDFFSKHYGVLKLEEKDQRRIEQLLTNIATEIQHKSIGYELSVMMKLAKLLIFALRCKADSNTFIPATTATTAKHRKVDEVASYIVNNCTKPLSLDSLSKHFFVSKCYLSRIFKEVTGFTVNEYINIHRVQKAQNLLLYSDFNITEISEQLGFQSITYFVRVFKKYTETSPLQYRKQNKKEIQPIRAKKAELEE